MHFSIKKLGPGLLFAGAAIGVSHLVQSTRAGAEYGWGLFWVVFIAHLFKYPFFQFGTRYALATGESLLDGYKKLGKAYLWGFFIMSLGTMFTIQTAVTIVTASIAVVFFDSDQSLLVWSTLITLACLAILWKGKYSLLDRIIKWIILVLTISTLVAVFIAGANSPQTLTLKQELPQLSAFVFLAALMGWMPAPLDISVWQSLWALEKKKNKTISLKEGLFDFNFGYVISFFLGVCFMGLGAFVMYGSGDTFSASGSVFAKQLIALYTSTLGESVYYIIVIACFTTIFSTTLTTLDASPRSMAKTASLLLPSFSFLHYRFWILILAAGTLGIFIFLQNEMGTLVQIATVLSFVTAPFYAFLNYKLVTSPQMPKEQQPKKGLKIMALVGFVFLCMFTLSFLVLAL